MGTIGGGFFAGLIGERYGWRASFVVFGGRGILLGCVLSRFLDRAGARRIDASDAMARRRPLSLTGVPAAAAHGRRRCSA